MSVGCFFLAHSWTLSAIPRNFSNNLNAPSRVASPIIIKTGSLSAVEPHALQTRATFACSACMGLLSFSTN